MYSFEKQMFTFSVDLFLQLHSCEIMDQNVSLQQLTFISFMQLRDATC